MGHRSEAQISERGSGVRLDVEDTSGRTGGRKAVEQKGRERLDGMWRVPGATAAISLISFPPVSQLASCRVRRISAKSIGAQFPLRAHLPLVVPHDFTYARSYLLFFFHACIAPRALLTVPAAAFCSCGVCPTPW